jgi:hypothetical protein
VGEDGEGNWMEVRTAVCGRRRRVVPPVRASDFKSCQKSFSACQGAAVCLYRIDVQSLLV